MSYVSNPWDPIQQDSDTYNVSKDLYENFNNTEPNRWGHHFYIKNKLLNSRDWDFLFQITLPPTGYTNLHSGQPMSAVGRLMKTSRLETVQMGTQELKFHFSNHENNTGAIRFVGSIGSTRSDRRARNDEEDLTTIIPVCVNMPIQTEVYQSQFSRRDICPFFISTTIEKYLAQGASVSMVLLQWVDNATQDDAEVTLSMGIQGMANIVFQDRFLQKIGQIYDGSDDPLMLREEINKQLALLPNGGPGKRVAFSAVVYMGVWCLKTDTKKHFVVADWRANPALSTNEGPIA